jgi:2-pyrone-4,6-dicarboxylate lactonase
MQQCTVAYFREIQQVAAVSHQPRNVTEIRGTTTRQRGRASTAMPHHQGGTMQNGRALDESANGRGQAAGAVCDTHVHIFGPSQRFPFVADRRYTPPDALIDDYLRLAGSLGIERAVLTQPSIHGLDNSAMLAAIASAPERLRGVVMADTDVDDATLQHFHEAGVRALRTQLKPPGGKPLDLAGLRQLATRVAPLGWHVEVHVDVGRITDIDEQCAAFPVPVVIEHMGHMPAGLGVEAPGFQALLRLLREGNWVKLSGPYINSAQPAPHEDVRPFVDALLDAAPERAVWGTNWPHPHQDVLPDDHGLVETIVRWIDDERLRHNVLVANPARLYAFE